MNIEELLENYNMNKVNIEIAKKSIEDLEDDLVSIRTSKIDGMPKAKGFSTSNIEMQIINIEEKKNKIKKYKKKLEYEISIVDNLLNILKKRYRDIIEMRFFERKDIEEISVIKNRNRDTINKNISKSISILQNEYNKIVERIETL